MDIENRFKRIDTIKEQINRRIDTKLGSRLQRLDKRLVQMGVKEPDLDTSYGLYDISVKSGLKPQADKILKAHAGEHPREFWSGGFISDTFDTLNALQYGVVGVLKGKSFNEGVLSRESFTDKDSLGQYGLAGIVGGLALDIAFDPLTYVAPWTILKKVPGLTKGLKATKEWTFGKMATEMVSEGKTYQKLTGGTKIGRHLAEKFKYAFGQDPVYKAMAKQKDISVGIATNKVIKMGQSLHKVPNEELVKKVITKDEFGAFIRKPIKQLQEELSPEDFKQVGESMSFFDTELKKVGREMVDLGLLDKRTFEKNFDSFLSQYYMHYDEVGSKIMASTKAGIKGGRKRLSHEEVIKNYVSHLGDEAKKLHPELYDKMGKLSIKKLEETNPEKFAELAKKGREAMQEVLGGIESPAYLLTKTLTKMIYDVENAKFFQKINKSYGSDIAQEGLKQLPKGNRLDINKAKRIEVGAGIKDINKTIGKEIKNLQNTFKGDKKILKQIDSLDKDVLKMSDDLTDDLGRFISDIKHPIKGVSITARKLGIIPERLNNIANQIKKFTDYDTMLKSKSGIALEKLEMGGDLQRHGYKSMREFFDNVKKPFKKGKEELIDDATKIRGEQLVKLQSKVEKTRDKLSKIKDIDKKSLDNSFIHLEKKINDLRFYKEDLVEDLGKLRLGNLAGKYVPESIYNDLTEMGKITDPNFGQKLMAKFKYGHVILNPATQIRNIVSNRLLNWWKLGIGPWRVDIDLKVIKAMKEGVGNKYIKLATKEGWGIDTMVSQEIRNFADPLQRLSWGKGGLNTGKKILNKFADLYQGSENYAKLSAFIYKVDKGISPAEAWKFAESATFNYSEVTPFIRQLRTSAFGFPFITFTTKATPIAIETAFKAPHRISAIGKVKNTIENQADIKITKRERAAEAPWIKDGFYIKLPHKDSDGRSMYFDLTYILPFGDLMSGEFFQRSVVKQTGTVEPWFLGVAGKSPFINAVKELSRNQDFSGRRIWKDSDSTAGVGANIMRYLTKVMMPPVIADQIPGGFNDKGVQAEAGFKRAIGEKEGTQQRNLMQEMLKHVGVKIQPIDVGIAESMQDWNIKKGLRTMLKDNTVVKDFSSTYIPK